MNGSEPGIGGSVLCVFGVFRVFVVMVVCVVTSGERKSNSMGSDRASVRTRRYVRTIVPSSSERTQRGSPDVANESGIIGKMMVRREAGHNGPTIHLADA